MGKNIRKTVIFKLGRIVKIYKELANIVEISIRNVSGGGR